jgi:flagellar hook-basal body complex protein FliE
MAIPTLTVTPHSAAQAYRAVESGISGKSSGDSFGGALARAMDGVVKTSNAAEGQAMKAISGTGNITEMVATVAQAELALQTTMTVRDRVVQAYQDIMRMPL